MTARIFPLLILFFPIFAVAARCPYTIARELRQLIDADLGRQKYPAKPNRPLLPNTGRVSESNEIAAGSFAPKNAAEGLAYAQSPEFRDGLYNVITIRENGVERPVIFPRVPATKADIQAENWGSHRTILRDLKDQTPPALHRKQKVPTKEYEPKVVDAIECLLGPTGVQIHCVNSSGTFSKRNYSAVRASALLEQYGFPQAPGTPGTKFSTMSRTQTGDMGHMRAKDAVKMRAWIDRTYPGAVDDMLQFYRKVFALRPGLMDNSVTSDHRLLRKFVKGSHPERELDKQQAYNEIYDSIGYWREGSLGFVFMSVKKANQKLEDVDIGMKEIIAMERAKYQATVSATKSSRSLGRSRSSGDAEIVTNPESFEYKRMNRIQQYLKKFVEEFEQLP